MLAVLTCFVLASWLATKLTHNHTGWVGKSYSQSLAISYSFLSDRLAESLSLPPIHVTKQHSQSPRVELVPVDRHAHKSASGKRRKIQLFKKAQARPLRVREYACWARHKLQAWIANKELLPMEHHTLLSASESRCKDKTTQFLGLSSCLHTRKAHVSLGSTRAPLQEACSHFDGCFFPPSPPPNSATLWAPSLHHLCFAWPGSLRLVALTHDVDSSRFGRSTFSSVSGLSALGLDHSGPRCHVRQGFKPKMS